MTWGFPFPRFNKRFRLGILTESQRGSLLRLIHKKDHMHLPKIWRLISLLNTDYKLASKAITERLKSVMLSIIHQDQTCSVPGRSICSNLHLVRDVLDMIDKTKETVILVTLDQEKAFDRVDHEFLMKAQAKPSSTPRSRRQCGLGGGETMVPPPMALNGFEK